VSSLIATARPDEQALPLLVHVLGAMVLVGGLLAGASSLALGRRDAASLRVGYWSLIAAALPGWLAMRIGAQWIYSEQGWADLPDTVEEPTWLRIGYVVADLGGLLLLASLIAGGIGVRRVRAGRGEGLLRATLVLAVVLLAAYVVAAWAMAGKPD
jgi:hypothetical protein